MMQNPIPDTLNALSNTPMTDHDSSIDSASGGDAIDFGYREVPREDKARMVRGVFDSVAGRYDLMNDLMSGGLHRFWKASLVAELAPRAGERLIDVAGGTGDISFRAQAAAKGALDAVIVDANAAMVSVGRDRAMDRGVKLKGGSLGWVTGDAEHLPLPDASADAVVISFGLRNVTDRLKALRDMRRVLRPGGRFFCLEFSHMENAALQAAYDSYSFAAIPKLGKLTTGDADSYQYLIESIRRFPRQEELLALMDEAGFEQTSFRNMTGGVVAVHRGWRL
jgi:demethylmenaquinone methyltransferase / 2-methoxy-6-polyprenyl-1,4-benzoquinol methylase